MKTPETSRLFVKRTDPVSGVSHYVLSERLAAYQQGFYFVNNSMMDDGRYLWFYASYPPVFSGALRQLGFIDFETDEMFICRDTLFESASPYIDPQTGDAYFAWSGRIFRRAPRADAATEELYAIPSVGVIRHCSTHLTLTADGNEFFMDVNAGNDEFFVGTVNRRTGTFTKWADAPHMMNHGQANPVDNDLALCAYDHSVNILTGESRRITTNEDGVYERLWTVTRDGKRTLHPARDNYATHEWWSADGKKIYYCNPKGIQRLDLTTGEHINRHPCCPWHAHTTPDETKYVFDEVIYDRFKVWYRGCPAAVKFWNAETDREITIVTRMPENGFTPDHPNNYHIDPHPRFTDNGRYVVFTTTEFGGADLAVVPVSELLERTT